MKRSIRTRGEGSARLFAVVSVLALFGCTPLGAFAESFTIGGSISNLVGSGLLLQLDAPGACVATFNLAIGTSTAAQPANQACTNARLQCCSQTDMREMDSVDVNGNHSCTVTCGSILDAHPNTFRIAGSTQDASLQTISPAANASSYVFPDNVLDGASYTVSISAQPSAPAQICGITNATGKVAGANVTNVDVNCVLVSHTVTATAGPNGSVSPTSQSALDGATAVVTLSPASGFSGSATGCGGVLGDDGVTYTISPVTTNCLVTATFTAIPKLTTTTTLTLAPTQTLINKPVAATANVTNNNPSPNGDRPGEATISAVVSAAPSGTVTISGGGQSCNAVLVNGIGSCMLAYPNAGTYTLAASYPGDALDLPSTGTAALGIALPAPPTPEPSPTLGKGALALLGLAFLALGLRWIRGSRVSAR